MPQALITLVLQDADADTSAVSVFVSAETGDTVTSLTDDYAHVFWDVVRPLVTGILVDVQVTIKPDFSGWTNNTLDLTSDVQEKVLFSLRPCGGLRAALLSLPTVKETIFENSGTGKRVDFTNSDVIAFVAAVENGVVDGGIGMTDSHGTDICKVVAGEQLFRGR